MKTGRPPSQILIVDDAIDNINMLRDMMELRGYDVRVAMNGHRALSEIEEQIPDLVLLDIHMPGIDGYEVCERIKANDATADVPVIFLSAYQEIENILQGFKVGGVDYISKPFQFREVIVRVENQLMIAKQRQELIQQRRQIQALREKDRQRFDKLTAMKDEFLRAAAHDLRNPLTTISLYCQQLETESRATDNDALNEIAYGIRKSTHKMQDLITDILDLAKMQIGVDIRKRETALIPLIDEVIQDFLVIAKNAGITLRWEPPGDDIIIFVDRTRIGRVFDNLISNAIKYTSDGGTVSVKIERTSDQVLIHIRDDGLGIPKDDIPRLFDAFYRVKEKSHRKKSGTGLGLSIVDTIVQQHDGNVTVDSKLHHGSTFTVHLPIIQNNAEIS